MLAATRSGVMPVSWLRAKASAHQVEFLHDLVGEACIGARIKRERGQVVPVVVQDLADAIAVTLALHRLSFAEHLARDGIERIVVHAHERAAQQVDAVEHQRPGIAACPLPK